MPTPTTPGVYVEETGTARAIAAAGMHVTAFMGRLDNGPVGQPIKILSLSDFVHVFGPATPDRPTAIAIQLFFAHGGSTAWIVRVAEEGDLADAIIGAIGDIVEPSEIAVVLAPDCTTLSRRDGGRVHDTLIRFARSVRAMAILDVDDDAAASPEAMIAWRNNASTDPHAAVYFPRLKLHDGSVASVSGAAAGIWARTDGASGPWKSPAGTNATIRGASGLAARLNDADRGRLNPHAINTLFDAPLCVWGARTLAGADRLGSERKYIPVQRIALMIERSIISANQWTIFEPNGEPLWAQLRLAVGAFLHSLFTQGAFQGSRPRDGYFVKCDTETTTAADIDAGAVNLMVGFAPLRPAEFVVLRVALRASTD